MPSDGLPRPYMVAAFFCSETQNTLAAGVEAAGSAQQAAANAVARYYLGGGKLTLIATSVYEVTRQNAQAAVDMLDAIDAAAKAEESKVARLVPAAVERPQWNCICSSGQLGPHSLACQLANQHGAIPDGAA